MDYTPVVEPAGLSTKDRVQFWKNTVAEEKRKLAEEKETQRLHSDQIKNIEIENSNMCNQQRANESQIRKFSLVQHEIVADILNVIDETKTDLSRLASLDVDRKKQTDHWSDEVEKIMTTNDMGFVASLVGERKKKNDELEKKVAMRKQNLSNLNKATESAQVRLKNAKDYYNGKVVDLAKKSNDLMIRMTIMDIQNNLSKNK